jgi:predicted GIY-YIG superfamily endonuclease
VTIHSGRTALYRLYDADRKLLYIGISQNPDVRWGQHSQNKPWWSSVEVREIEWHETRALAAAAEKAAIKTEQPYWNLNHAARPIGNSEAEKLFGEYREAREEARLLRPIVLAGAVDELKRGATPAQLAELTGESAEVFRRIREANDIPVDPRYESRAELARARKKAVPPRAGRRRARRRLRRVAGRHRLRRRAHRRP